MRSQVRASHILVKTEAEAKELLQEIREGKKSFADVAKEVSMCPSGSQGGDLGFFGHGMMVREFDKGAFDLKEIGDISEPIQTQFGWHLIQLTGVIDD